MGQICYCLSIPDSEEYIKQVFSSPCLKNLDKKTFVDILKRQANVNNQILENGGVFKITEKEFLDIMNSIFNQKNPNVPSTFQTQLNYFFDKDFFQKFLNGDDQMNETRGFIFEMLMLPFLFKENEENEDYKLNAESFFNIIKFIKFSEQKSSESKQEIPYKIFCELIQMYLSSVLSGYSLKMLEVMNKCNEKNDLIQNLEEHTKDLFTKNLINKYYIKIMDEYIIETENIDKVNEVKITKEKFCEIVKKNKQLVNYFQLRKDFFEFATETTKIENNYIRDNEQNYYNGSNRGSNYSNK